jgi:hypothetical protein
LFHIIGLVAALAAVPAPGYGDGSSRQPGARLEVSYVADAGYAAAVKLDCEPVGGGHPQGEQACQALEAAGGDPGRISPTLNACLTIYAPVLAEVRGTWHGTTIEWRQRYGNICEMRRATGGALFQF